MAELDHIIPEFIAESGQLLQTVEGGLLQMESGELGDEAVHTVFRAIHSVRSGAAIVGLAKIERLARLMEALLDLCRNGGLKPTQAVTDSLLQALDVLASLFNRVEEHESIDIESSLNAMEAALNTALEPALKNDIRKVDASALPNGLPLFEISTYCLESKLRQGHLYLIHLDMVQLDERCLTPIQLVHEMLSMGEILDSIVNQPSVNLAEEQEPSISFDIFYATMLEQDLLRAALRLDQKELRLLSPDDFRYSQAPVSDSVPESPPIEAPAPESEQMAVSQPGAKLATLPVQTTPQPVFSQDRTAFSNLEAPLESDDDSMGREYLTFTLGEENYGVDILSVQEIMALPRLTKLPRAPRHVLGVMNLRGMVVPVMDMRLRLNLPTETEIEPVVVVVKIGNKYMGAVVDSVSDVVEFKESEIQDPPDFAFAVHREYLRGLCRQGEELIVLLELDQILSPEA